MARMLRFAIIVAVLLAVAAALAWTFRLPLAERALERELAARGYPEASLEVTALSLHQATLERVELEPDTGPSARQIDLLYPLFEVLQGDIHGVEARIDGLRAHLDRIPLDREAEEVVPDDPTHDGLVATLVGLARIEISDGLVRLPSPPGQDWRLEFNGFISGSADGLQSAEINGQIDDREQDLAVTLAVRHTGEKIRGSLGLLPMGSGLEGQMDLRLDPPWDDAHAQVYYRVRLDGTVGPAPDWWPLPWPTAGEVELRGELEGMAGEPTVPSSLGGLIDRLIAGDWSGPWRVVGDDLSVNDQVTGVDIAARGGFTIADHSLVLTTDGSGEIDIATINPQQARRLPLPDDLARLLLASPVRMEWPARPVARLQSGPPVRIAAHPEFDITYRDEPTRLRLSADGFWERDSGLVPRAFQLGLTDAVTDAVEIAQLEVSGDLPADGGRITFAGELPHLHLKPLTAEAVTFAAGFDLVTTEDALRLEAGDDGRFTADVVAWGERLVSTAPLRASLQSGAIDPGASPEWSFDFDAEAGAWQGRIGAEDTIDLTSSAHRLRLSGPSPLFPLARARLDGLDLRADEPALVAQGVDLDLRPGRIQRWAQFTAERVLVDADPLPLSPIRLSGQIDDWADEGHRLHGSGTMADGAADLEFSSHLAGADGAPPEFELDWPALVFEPNGLQPSDLLPRLRGPDNVTGEVSASADLVLAGDGLDGRGQARSAGVDLDLGRARIEGLRGTIDLAGFRPWRSDGTQRLDADHLELGLGIDDPRARFTIDPRPGRGGVVEIAEAAGDFGGDRLYMPSWTFDPAATTHSFAIEAGPIALDALVDDLAIADLDASGRIAGRLPVNLIEDRIVIRDAQLRGQDGRVAFRGGAGEWADTTTDTTAHAFTDLDYDHLFIAIDQDLERNDELRIQARGRNPAVADGETADHGVRLTGDLAPLIDAILAGETIRTEDLQRHLQAVPEAP